MFISAPGLLGTVRAEGAGARQGAARRLGVGLLEGSRVCAWPAMVPSAAEWCVWLVQDDLGWFFMVLNVF